MLKEIIHIGITVSDMERSLKFYQDVLGLTFAGKLIMEGEATDKLFAMENCKALVYYLNGSDKIDAPPLELIQFLHIDVEKQRTNLARTSASEICFKVDDIDAVYQKLLANNVECLSEPQFLI